MVDPVNLENLREITGGDAELEAELFRSFLTSSSDCVKGLNTALDSGDEGNWRASAHAFKGICFNLGAGPLGELCKHAQDDCRAPAEDKRRMIEEIEGELARVRVAVEKLI